MSNTSSIAVYLTLTVCFSFTVMLLILPDHKSLDTTTWNKAANRVVDVRIDGSSSLKNLTAFWKSTGFCPPLPHQDDAKWFLSEDSVQNLKWIGSLPYNGIEQVRIHWLLDSIKHTGYNAARLPVYDFTKLDKLIHTLWSNELRPGFEVMGNPSGLFTDFENSTQVWMWRSLVYDLVLRYGEQYGCHYLSTWNFESWNEPSLHHFDNLNFTLQGFHNYYDATVDAIKAYDASLQMGGPGGSCHDYDVTSYCWSLLNHVVHGTNFITKRRGSPIDYLSVHKKGEDPNNTAVMLDKESQFYQILEEHLPELTKLPVYNDEADPLVGWNKDKWWRADVTYAAMVTKIITEHQNKWTTPPKTLNIKLLSNDNGFLSYNPHFFTQRTLLARFQMNITKPPHVQFIRKPVYAVMGLLSYLGEHQLSSYLDTTEKPCYVGVLATFHTKDPSTSQDSDQYSVIVYNSADTDTVTMETNLTIQLQNIQTTASMKVVVFQLDNNHGNPYAVWLRAGKPATPSAGVLRQMREHEEPVRVLGPSHLPTHRGGYFINLTLPLPGVLLIHLCEHAQSEPGQVTNVSVYNVTTGYTLITWSDRKVHSRCIKAYEVEKSNNGGIYQRINQNDTVFNSYMDVTDAEKNRYTSLYRVRAVDYWGRPGKYSLSEQLL